MANTIVQVRRSNTSASPGTILAAGELAYSYNTVTQALYMGSNAGVGSSPILIAGQKYNWLQQANTGTPGAQTANATVITDGNSFVYNVFSQGLILGSSVSGPAGNATMAFVSSISNTGNSTQIGANASGGGIGTELATTAAISAYVLAKTSGSSVSGSNTQIQFNNSAAFGSDANFTFDNVTDILHIGNSTVGAVDIGNSTVNSFSNQTSFIIRSSATVNTTIGSAQIFVANSTTNTVMNTVGVLIGNTTVNSFINSTALVIQSNSTVNTTITPTTLRVGNATVNLAFSSGLLDVRATNTNITSNVTITGANVDATSAFLKIQQALISGNLTVQGNLSVTGTLTSIDSTNIVVQDPVVIVNDGGTTTDTADAGWVAYFGNSTVTQVGGLVRKSGGAGAGYANTFLLFTSQTAFTNTTSTVPVDANLQLGTLQSWLYSSANSTTTGKLQSNSTGLVITANSTWSVGLTANTLSLSTQLPVTSGGTGVNTITLGGILLGNTTSAMVVLPPSSNGTVLQVLNSAAAGAASVVGYGGIDGGSF
jgi:hypothetical protein